MEWGLGARELGARELGYNGFMPIFEYRCTDCGKMFETFVTAERTPQCPGCRSANLAKLLSSPGMVGSGNGRSEPAPLAAGGGCGMGTCGCRPN
jgi:putative FmdB family regulatory protein